MAGRGSFDGMGIGASLRARAGTGMVLLALVLLAYRVWSQPLRVERFLSEEHGLVAVTVQRTTARVAGSCVGRGSERFRFHAADPKTGAEQTGAVCCESILTLFERCWRFPA